MSLHQTSEEKQEKQLSIRQRMALFQSNPTIRQRNVRATETRQEGKGTANSFPSHSQAQTEMKGGRSGSSNSLPNKPHSSSPCSPVPNSGPKKELLPFTLPSHCDSLFASLRSFKEDGLLLDCTIQLLGNFHKAHRLVLAAVSQKAKAWLLSGKMPRQEINICDLGGAEGQDPTPAGLKAVLKFAYDGEVDGDLKETLVACEFFEVERLAQACRGETLSRGVVEREKNLQAIRWLWEGQVGCDVIIQAENGERFPAHRVILAAGGDYFRALLCGGLKESEEEVVRVRGLPADVLRSLLTFIYSGQLNLGWQNVWDLSEAALQFQLQGALTLCLNFLQDHMDDASCLDALSLAEVYGLEQLRDTTEEYVLTHFQRVSACEKFKDLSCPLLTRLLERDGLRADSEVVVFRTVVSWVEEDEDLRLSSFPILLQNVRFPLMTPQELKEVQGCRLLNETSKGRTATELVEKLLEGKVMGCRPRTPNQVLVLVGGDCVDENFERREPNRCLWFARRFLRGEGLIRTVEWEALACLPEPPRMRHCVCVLNNILYVLGGRKYYGKMDILKSAVRFDPARAAWERLPDMASARDYFAAVCQGGKVFVLGGNYDDSTCLDSVEYYIPEDNIWRSAHPLATAVCGHAAAVLNGEIYVSGGCDSHLRCLSSLWHYDPLHGCSKLALMSLGAGRAGHIMLAVSDQLVVAGGLQPMWPGFEDQLCCEAYDLLRNLWRPLPLLPRPHLSPAATALDGQLYVLGGSSANSARDMPWVHRYDPQENCWDKLGTMPRPYADLAACTLQLPISLRG